MTALALIPTEVAAPSPQPGSVALCTAEQYRDAWIAWAQSELQNRDAWIVWYQAEMARRDGMLAELTGKVESLLDETFRLTHDFAPSRIAGRDDLRDGLTPTVAFADREAER